MDSVTVVIPAYNQARFLAQAIDSVLAQTHPHTDVVIVNDGSTDGTEDVLACYESRAEVTAVRQANRGLPAARNRGLDEARGSFVCFLDADDWLAPTYAARLLEPLLADEAVGFAYCDIQMMNEAGQASGDFSVGAARRQLSGDILESLLIGGYFPPHAALIRRATLDALGGFDLDLGGHADYELWLRLAASGALAHYVDEKLSAYRVYDGSMSRDLEHMRTTRVLALDRVARRYPARLAAALAATQDATVEVHTANTWMRAHWEKAIRHLEAAQATPTWSLVTALDAATVIQGAADQIARWDVALDGPSERCVYLHPPASLRLAIPVTGAGRLTASVAVHPDVWNKPEAAACLFAINVDDVVSGSVLLNPREDTRHRRWVSISADVPASATGEHVVTLETRAAAPGYFAWALVKNVEFFAAA